MVKADDAEDGENDFNHDDDDDEYDNENYDSLKMGSVCGVLTLDHERQCTLHFRNGVVHVLQMLPLGTPRKLQIQINGAVNSVDWMPESCFLGDDDVPLLAMFSSDEEL